MGVISCYELFWDKGKAKLIPLRTHLWSRRLFPVSIVFRQFRIFRVFIFLPDVLPRGTPPGRFDDAFRLYTHKIIMIPVAA